MTIPEALLCRRPVLATAVGGASDWVDDGTTGFICPTPTVDDLARGLRQAWQQRDRWEQMGAGGAAAVLARYRPDDYLQLIRP
jgi:glycosyltransferase involved in cell wall biosynthesis